MGYFYPTSAIYELQLQIIHSIKIIYISKFHCEIQRLAKVIQKIDLGHFFDVTIGR